MQIFALLAAVLLAILGQAVPIPDQVEQVMRVIEALLAAPAVVSWLTQLLRGILPNSVNPRHIVWGTGMGLAGLAVWLGDITITVPVFSGDVESYLLAWLSLGTFLVKTAQGYFDWIFTRLPILNTIFRRPEE